MLRADGQHVLTLTVAGGGAPMPLPAPPTYTCLDGTLRVTRWRTGAWARGRPRGAELELGDHEMAEELRSLGLPRRAMFSTAVPRLRARFGPARVVQA